MKLYELPLDLATTPRDGKTMCERWWFVGPNGLIFAKFGNTLVPQCNQHKAVLESIKNQHPLYQNLEIRKVPVVYLGNNPEFDVERICTDTLMSTSL